MSAFALIATLFAAAPAARAAHPDCEALYYGEGVARNYERAFACYQAEENWLMVAVMQLNGDGTPVDVAGARKSLAANEEGHGAVTGDQMSLDAVLKQREANPKAKGPRVDFCDDVAATTPSLNWCQSRELAREQREREARIHQMRSRLEKSAWATFDALAAAFEPFAQADAMRVYQEYVEGTIRNAYAMSQEKLDRENFEAVVTSLSAEVTAVPQERRAFAAADAELNTVYRELVRSMAGGWENEAATDADQGTAATHRQYAEDYRKAARAAQRAWLRYRDLAGQLAALRWPDVPGIADVVRSLVTDDRIRELHASEGP